MAPTKFEENMRENLEKRTIQPKAKSWQQLSSKLDTEQDSKKSSRFWWIGIAAGLIVMFSVSYAFLKDGNIKNKAQEIVNMEQTKTLNNKASEKLNPFDTKNKLVIEEESISVANVTEDKVAIDTSPNSKIEKYPIKTAGKKNDDNERVQTLIAVTKPKATMEPGLSAEEIKVQEVVAEIMKLQNDKIAVTDKEIDSLLKSAQKELIANKINKDETLVVSAEALLQDVEAELEDSFREKVFDALRNSYETVKTAVAQRNN